MAHPAQSYTAGAAFDKIAIDLVALDPSASGYCAVLTVVDYVTRWASAYPLADKMAQSVAAKLLWFFADFGVPRVVVSDNGKEFVNKVVEEVNRQMGVQIRHTAPFAPWQNGRNERFNGTMIRLIRRLPQEFRRQWDAYLPLVLMAYRACVHSATGYSPNMLVFGRESRSFAGAWTFAPGPEEPPEAELHAAILHRAEELRKLKEIVFPSAMLRVHRTALTQREEQDQRVTVVVKPLKRGKIVWKWVEDRAAKTGDVYDGPFTVVSQDSSGNYVLRNWHGEVLPQKTPIQKLKLGRDVAREDEVYQVEAVCDHRQTAEGREFLVRWVGYPGMDSWVREDDFMDDGTMIWDYFRQRESAQAQAMTVTAAERGQRRGEVMSVEHRHGRRRGAGTAGAGGAGTAGAGGAGTKGVGGAGTKGVGGAGTKGVGGAGTAGPADGTGSRYRRGEAGTAASADGSKGGSHRRDQRRHHGTAAPA